MILAYLRTKLCSLNMNRDRLLIPSRRSRRKSRFHRPSLGIAVVVRTGVAGWSLPARVVLGREASIAAWPTPAVLTADALTTTSIAAVNFSLDTQTTGIPNATPRPMSDYDADRKSPGATHAFIATDIRSQARTQVHKGAYLPRRKPITTVLRYVSDRARFSVPVAHLPLNEPTTRKRDDDALRPVPPYKPTRRITVLDRKRASDRTAQHHSR